jgi:hypothetical protein
MRMARKYRRLLRRYRALQRERRDLLLALRSQAQFEETIDAKLAITDKAVLELAALLYDQAASRGTIQTVECYAGSEHVAWAGLTDIGNGRWAVWIFSDDESDPYERLKEVRDDRGSIEGAIEGLFDEIAARGWTVRKDEEG